MKKAPLGMITLVLPDNADTIELELQYHTTVDKTMVCVECEAGIATYTESITGKSLVVTNGADINLELWATLSSRYKEMWFALFSKGYLQPSIFLGNKGNMFANPLDVDPVVITDIPTLDIVNYENPEFNDEEVHTIVTTLEANLGAIHLTLLNGGDGTVGGKHPMTRNAYAIIKWGTDRKLTKFDVANEVRMLESEYNEYCDAPQTSNPEHEAVDAIMDIYVVLTQTFAKAFNAGVSVLDYTELRPWVKMYLDIPRTIHGMGYDFVAALSETIKEINSREGAVDATGKFQKFTTEEYTSKWYTADFTAALLPTGVNS